MKTYSIFLMVILTSVSFFSCDEMNSIHQQYLDQEKKIYLGKTDSINAFSGKERIKLVWYYNSDPRITETVIYWNQGQDSIVKPFVRVNAGVQKDSVLIDNLLGTYVFTIFNRNDFGDKSIPVQVQGTAYGDNYVEELKPRAISAMTITAFDAAAKTSKVKIEWVNASAQNLRTKLVYKNQITGELVVLLVNNSDKITEIEGVGNDLGNPDHMLQLTSFFVPQVGAIDTFETNVFTEQVVSYYGSGKKSYYLATGTFSSSVNFTNLVKTLRKITNEVYYCDRVGQFTLNKDYYLRLMMSEDNLVSASGEYQGYISDGAGTSVFDPVTKVFTLNFRKTNANGTYDVIEETLSPR